MRILLLSLIVLPAAAVLACSGADDDVSPTSVPVLTPTTSTDPPPLDLEEPLVAAGWLIHTHDSAIHVSALDGEGDVTLDLPGMAPEHAGFAGVAVVEGVRWLYFVAQLSHEPTGTDYSTGEFALVRVRAGDTAVEDVTRFRSASGGGYGTGVASIAPDGSRFLHRGADEIALVDLATGTLSMIFNGTCAGSPYEKCEAYGSPQWSPVGDAMVAKHHYYEGSTAVFARPISASGALELNEYGGEEQAWAPDGASFCTYSTSFVPGGLWLVDARTLVAQDLAQRFPENTGLEGCWIGRDGMIAVMFTPAGDSGFSSRVAVLESGDAAEPGTILALPDFWRVEGWLPDSSGLVVSKSNNCTPCNPDEQLVATLTLDGAMHALPFEVANTHTSERDTDFVLAIVAP